MVKIPENKQPVSSGSQKSFRETMLDAGFLVQGEPVEGGPHRVNVSGDKQRSLNGWYYYHRDAALEVGTFGSWKDSSQFTWSSRDIEQLSFKERAEYEKRRKAQIRAAEEAKRKAAAFAAEEARKELGATSQAAEDHEYLKSKGIGPNGALSLGNKLFLPLRNVDGDITSRQTIDTDGTKSFIKDGEKLGSYFVIAGDPNRIGVAEGFATGATIHEVTGATVFVCFDTSNIKPVCEAIRTKTDKQIVIYADDDRQTLKEHGVNPGQKYAKAACEAVPNTIMKTPVFPDGDLSSSDWNDLGHALAKIQLVDGPQPFSLSLPSEEALSKIPARVRLTDDFHHTLKYVSGTIGEGGAGKSTLIMAEMLSICTGKKLLHCQPVEPRKVWYWNLEDDNDELNRRLAALLGHFKISHSEIAGRFFMTSGREQRLNMGERPDRFSSQIVSPDKGRLIDALRSGGISLLAIDPFLKSHNLDENDNKQIDRLVEMYSEVADGANCAIDLVHHLSKAGGNSKPGEAGTARGASALIGALRSVRTVTKITEEDVTKFSLDAAHAYKFSRVDNAKANMSDGSANTQYFQKSGYRIKNGESVGVIQPWKPQGAFDRVTTKDTQQIFRFVLECAKAGKALSLEKKKGNLSLTEMLEARFSLDPSDSTLIVKQWIKNSKLREETQSPEDGKPYIGLVAGHKASDGAPGEMGREHKPGKPIR